MSFFDNFNFTKIKGVYLDICWYFFPVWRLKKSGAKVGKNVFIGRHVYVELENAHLLTIEDGVVIAAYSKIILHDSSLNNINGYDILYGQVRLKKNSYIGANVTILPGTVIEEKSLIGANSLVKGLTKKDSVYVGQPARRICSTSDLQKKWQNNQNHLIYFKNKNA